MEMEIVLTWRSALAVYVIRMAVKLPNLRALLKTSKYVGEKETELSEK